MICYPTDLRYLNELLDTFCAEHGVTRASRHRKAAAEVLATAYEEGVRDQNDLEGRLRGYSVTLVMDRGSVKKVEPRRPLEPQVVST